MGNGTLDDSGRGNAAPLLVPDNQTGMTGGRQGRGGREQGRGGEGRERGESEKRESRCAKQPVGHSTDYWITDYEICLDWITGLRPGLGADYWITAWA